MSKNKQLLSLSNFQIRLHLLLQDHNGEMVVSTKELAAELGMSVSTIRKHIKTLPSDIFQIEKVKIGVYNLSIEMEEPQEGLRTDKEPEKPVITFEKKKKGSKYDIFVRGEKAFTLDCSTDNVIEIDKYVSTTDLNEMYKEELRKVCNYILDKEHLIKWYQDELIVEEKRSRHYKKAYDNLVSGENLYRIEERVSSEQNLYHVYVEGKFKYLFGHTDTAEEIKAELNKLILPEKQKKELLSLCLIIHRNYAELKKYKRELEFEKKFKKSVGVGNNSAVNKDEAREMYKKLITFVHPDRFAQGTEREIARATEATQLLNKFKEKMKI